MKSLIITTVLICIFSFCNSCGQSTSTQSEERITLCTKSKCCCPDSIVIDLWDKHLGLNRVKPKNLSTSNMFKAINTVNASRNIGFLKPEPEYVIRAYYVGSINPRIIKIWGKYIKEDGQNWFDTGIADFGGMLYENK